MVVSAELGHVYATRNFNVARDKKQISLLESFISTMPNNSIVLGSVKGDASRNFGKEGTNLLVCFH